MSRVATAHLRMVAIETSDHAKWGQGLSFWDGTSGVPHWQCLVQSVRQAHRWATPDDAFAAREAGEIPRGFRLRWADCGKAAQARREAEGLDERTGQYVVDRAKFLSTGEPW